MIQDLIKLAKEKDQKSQTRLTNLFWVDVFSFVMKKVRDENIADEITIGVFSKVLNKLDLYDPEFEFKTWLLMIAQNTIIDYWRKQSREVEVLPIKETFMEIQRHSTKSPEEFLISEEDRRKIQDLVASMNNNYAEIIQLRFFEELSIKEIAKKLNISVDNTKIRIMRAKKVLAQLLKDNDFNSPIIYTLNKLFR